MCIRDRYTYCCILVGFLLVYSGTFLIIKMYKMGASYMVIVYVIPRGATAAAVAYYSVLFMKASNNNRNILNSLHHVDKLFNSFGVTLPHVKCSITVHAMLT